MTRDEVPVIEVQSLTTRYGEHVVHRDLSLAVRRGEVLGIVGGSGSGKTTLLRHMLGLEHSTEGTVRVFGTPLPQCDRAELRARWGVLFQQGALFSALTAFDNIALPLREMGTLDAATIGRIVMMKLASVEIEARHAGKLPAELSGGMVKRVALARALALDPELLFLDEPTAGLDPDRSDAFVRLIRRLREALKLTVVIVTHDLDTLVALADRVAVLADGHIAALGPLARVAESEHPFIQRFFGGARGRRATATLDGVDLPV